MQIWWNWNVLLGQSHSLTSDSFPLLAGASYNDPPCDSATLKRKGPFTSSARLRERCHCGVTRTTPLLPLSHLCSVISSVLMSPRGRMGLSTRVMSCWEKKKWTVYYTDVHFYRFCRRFKLPYMTTFQPKQQWRCNQGPINQVTCQAGPNGKQVIRRLEAGGLWRLFPYEASTPISQAPIKPPSLYK